MQRRPRRPRCPRATPCVGSRSCSNATARAATGWRRSGGRPALSSSWATTRWPSGYAVAPSRRLGIGKTTAAVIEQAVAGEVPTYLASLSESAGALTDGGDELYGQVIGDLHAHSNWSDGGAPLDENGGGRDRPRPGVLAMTDHSPRLRVANGLSVERLTQQLDVIDALNADLDGELTILTGIEGRHPHRRRAGPDRRDARPSAGGHRLRALRAEDGRRPDDATDGRRSP